MARELVPDARWELLRNSAKVHSRCPLRHPRLPGRCLKPRARHPPPHLLEGERLAWLCEGWLVELAPRQELALEPGCHLLVLTGALEAPRMMAQGTVLMEVDRPLRVMAQEATRLNVLPLLASPALERALGASATKWLALSLASMELPRAVA